MDFSFSSHLVTHAQSLVDLSLYVSSENYIATTRPSYSEILPWPTQFFIPAQIRAFAKSRSQHLGLSSLDLDTVDDEQERSRRKLGDVIPAALRASTQTVTELVKQKQSTARFKLEALVDSLCEPLDQLIGDKKYFLSDDRCSSLDCLALGYLALGLKPDVPQKWLSEGIRNRYPRLYAFVGRGIHEFLGGKVAVEDAFLHQNFEAESADSGPNQSQLPWRSLEQRGIKTAGAIIYSSIVDLIPFSQPNILASSTDDSNTISKSGFSPLVALLLTASTSIVATAGYFLYDVAVSAPKPEKRSLDDMGEAGALFAGLDFGGVGGSGSEDKIPIVESQTE